MHSKGPYEVLERKDGHDYLIKVGTKEKVFHANLLKQYFTAGQATASESSLDESVTQNPVSNTNATFAAILEPEEGISEHTPELETLNSLQKETVKDVKISQDLSEEQKLDVRTLLNEYQDIFTDVPNITPLEEHRIQLTTAEPIREKA